MSNTLTDTTPLAITQKALSFNFSEEEKSRRSGAILNKDFYYGKQEQALQLVNEDEDPFIVNLTKPIIKKRTSLLYSKPLVREFEGPTESINYLEETYRSNKIDSFLLAVDLQAELTGSAIVMPQLLDDGSTKLRLYDASEVSVVPVDGDPNEAAAITISSLIDRLLPSSRDSNPQAQRILRSQIWTKNAVTVYDGQHLVSSSTNDLGYLPFVNFKSEPVHGQYLGHAQATIVRKLNAHVNQLLTHLGFMIKFQAGSPIALEGYQSGEGITVHPGRALSLPNGASASVLNMDPKIQDTLATIQYLEEKIFETASVPKISVVGGEGQSGRELLVRWFPLLKVFEEKAVRFQDHELELANMILLGAGLAPVASLVINWPDEDLLPLSASDDTLERDIKLSLKTPMDELMRRDPLLEESEAEALVRSNNDFNNSLSQVDSAE